MRYDFYIMNSTFNNLKQILLNNQNKTYNKNYFGFTVFLINIKTNYVKNRMLLIKYSVKLVSFLLSVHNCCLRPYVYKRNK